METTEQQDEKIKELETRLDGWETEHDDAGFLSQQTFCRYLEARDWNVDDAENQLKSTISWRRETKPQHVVCTYCHSKPGYHAMRHVGFDLHDRPVIYSNFAQCLTQQNSVDDAMQHMLWLTENVTRSMLPHVYQFVWVMDFTGVKVSSCNPLIARAVEQVVSNHYPERLGACIFVNHGVIFHAFWVAVKHFIPPRTVNKIHMGRHHGQLDALFSQFFSIELKRWLYEEIRLNKLHPIPMHQKEFWKAEHSGHDSRGCESYVQQYVENFPVDSYKSKCNIYLPHPNILNNITE